MNHTSPILYTDIKSFYCNSTVRSFRAGDSPHYTLEIDKKYIAYSIVRVATLVAIGLYYGQYISCLQQQLSIFCPGCETYSGDAADEDIFGVAHRGWA